MDKFDELMQNIRGCKVCEPFLPLGANPIVQAHAESKIIVIGQAPGLKVHQSNIPWNDASGDQLRKWLQVTKDQFYDPKLFALVPIGFCYPGKGTSGDLPPRKECAPLWHKKLLTEMPNVQLTLLIGQYAQRYYLQKRAYRSITENIQHYKEYIPQYFPLPHPSPRNFIWMNKNPWFHNEVLPVLGEYVASII